MHTHTNLTNVTFVQYACEMAITILWRYFTYSVLLLDIIGEKINIHCEFVTSQPDLLVPTLTFLNFQSSITILFILRFA